MRRKEYACPNGCSLPPRRKQLREYNDGSYGFDFYDFTFCPCCGSLMPYSLKKLKGFFEVYNIHAALSDAVQLISEEDELWLEKYYKTAYKLLEKDSFQTAVHTMASYRWHSVPRVQLAVIWSGIESLFNVNTEVSFRISLYIANFLGENEAQAQQIFKQVRKMYSSRSSAVHGNKTKDNLESAVEESANLLTRILRRCAELNKLPDVDNLAFRVDKQTKARH